jgi:hypothetical protein
MLKFSETNPECRCPSRGPRTVKLNRRQENPLFVQPPVVDRLLRARESRAALRGRERSARVRRRPAGPPRGGAKLQQLNLLESVGLEPCAERGSSICLGMCEFSQKSL